ADEGKGLNDFLSKVDQIEKLVKGLNAEDDEERKAAFQDSDAFLAEHLPPSERSKTGKAAFDRTLINKSAGDGMSPQDSEQPTCQDEMMKVLEADAADRYNRRQVAKKEADELKEKGNVEFKNGNYEGAIEWYTKGLDVLKDTIALWTNRAQANIKLGRYKEALHDCEWALKVDEMCLKAYVHQGKANLGLKQYDQAIESYNNIKRIDKKKENMVKGYINEVELARASMQHEEAAKASFQSGNLGAKGVVELLEKLIKPGEMAIYYAGGCRLLGSLLTDTDNRTLFRTHGGLSLTESHPTIQRCFNARVQSLSGEGLDLCAAIVELIQAACTDNEENQKQIVVVPGISDSMVAWLECTVKGTVAIKTHITHFLHTISQTDTGRVAIIKNFDLSRLLGTLFGLVNLGDKVALSAVALLNNLALEKAFKSQIRGNIEEDVLPAFEQLMITGTNISLLPCVISTVTNLCGDVTIRKKVGHRRETWSACCNVLAKYTPTVSAEKDEEIIYSILGLLINMTTEKYDAMQTFTRHLCENCCKLVQCDTSRIYERSYAVLSHILPSNKEAVTMAMEHNIMTKILEHLQMYSPESAIVKHCARCLPACTQLSPNAVNTIVNTKKGLGTVVGLLKPNDEAIQGNAALCLTHCTQTPGVASKLTKTSIIKHLLILARDGRRPELQQNCAILLAKLAQADTRHLETLRELHGIEILADCMKFIK
ncbi:unnamed protein product, partial [Owenia fusiformis]